MTEDLPEEEAEENRRPIWMPPLHFVLGVAVLVSIPALVNFVNGSLDVNSLLVRFVVALVIGWVGLFIVGNVINAYLPPEEPDEPEMLAIPFGGDADGLMGYGSDDLQGGAFPAAEGEDAGDMVEPEGEG